MNLHLGWRAKTLILVASVCLLLANSGCMTMTTLEAARPQTHKDEKGEVVIDKQSEPGYYALIPLTVAGDVATLPFQLLIALLSYCSGIRC